jgi:hypothetical protein
MKKIKSDTIIKIKNINEWNSIQKILLSEGYRWKNSGFKTINFDRIFLGIQILSDIDMFSFTKMTIVSFPLEIGRYVKDGSKFIRKYKSNKLK